MSWRHTFTAVFGPGLFAGLPAGDWLRVLRANRFAVHPYYALRFLSITSASFANSFFRPLERLRFGRQLSRETIQPPLFVLGHWRSGTTHLHNLLTQDDRFAFPNLYEVLYPHTFLTTQAVNARLMSFLVPSTRFGVDNMRIGWSVPYEDEFAIAAMSQLSPYMTMAFPRRQDHYDRFLTLADASPEELQQWKDVLTTFLKKLTWKYKQPLILKSPTHTCRIKLLLSLFPDARFVHIRRNPFHVFQSMKRMLSGALRYWQLQSANCVDWVERVILQYRQMYQAYFEQRRLIPPGRLHEIAYEDLEADPLGQLDDMYQALQLPDFGHMEPAVRQYVATLSGYQKNRFAELPAGTSARLAHEWRLCFDEWVYASTQ